MQNLAFRSHIPLRPVLDAIRPLRCLLDFGSRRTAAGKLYGGQGQPVMVLPVYGGGPSSTARMRAILDEAGFNSYDWGLGYDKGPQGLGLGHCLRRLEEQVIDAFEIERRPVTLVGWGLSGIYAREIAKRTTPLVRQVITLSTPFNLTAPGQQPCSMLRALQGRKGRLDPAVALRLRQRPPVPCTSIYSTIDKAVPWEMCLETESLMSENVQVMAAHHSQLAEHPKVLEIISQRLAQPEEGWRPYDA